ncbi:ShlB/FhaC/HecB family hemolysin secretion/activation protein [Variovorax sp. Sphag1AA]|uniref:ShlB/FhaC/HecB family hemolysin secretion/activation protein n=1 Tax=Variovorax sp. Sphag1AA TaxID=2587027 RepID=UPI00162195F5|nr:ShlB/FhaC/HecB family hemolysin secretion/activation protein [Variovorax sp. Sphag1AA]
MGLAGPHAAHAQIASTPRPFVEEQRQQERERAVREQNERAVDVRRPTEPPAAGQRLPEAESPCFRIDRIRLVGERSEAFQWALAAMSEAADGMADNPIGRCLGTEGINIVLARVQQALVARGWVTARVLVGPQDLATGELALTLIPGRVAAIRLADASGATTDAPLGVRMAIPASRGDLLNLRDIEQGLENLKRLPTAEADIRIAPSSAADARPGDSDLVVQYRQGRADLPVPLRANLSYDDSGTEPTGRNQGGLTLAWDGPLHLNDLFYVSLNHDLFNHAGRGTSGNTVHYSIPWGNWLFSTTASEGRYWQNVAGLAQDYTYSGYSSNAELRVDRMLYRDQHGKTSLRARAWQRTSHNYIDDTEVGVQERLVGGWELGLNHRLFLGTATLDGNLAYRRGTGAFGAIPAPEESFGEGTSRMKLVTADLNLNQPFDLGAQKLRYAGLWRAQWNGTPLTPQDRFAIGGRFTVRGFDGEASLMGDRGWLVRNDIGWALPAEVFGTQLGAELYLGVDYGQVNGRSAAQLRGKRLAGSVIGLRGAVRGLSYDFFVGTPISKPEGFHTSRWTTGFNLNYGF